jgi:acetaldehyde dehydrogenase (acetylating)
MGEARTLARRARAAHLQYAEFSQERIDAVVDAAAGAVAPLAEALATLAVEETGFGVVADKIQKNTFAAVRVHEFVRPLKTVGVIRRDEARKVVEIAEPFGPVAAIIPSTNPTSTAIYKILIALKARCAIVLSPHPSAVRCITKVAEVMSAAAVAAGAPEGTISWMTTVTLEGTQELMRQREIAVILATGGLGLVRAAYSAGKPAYGVGPGNAPCFVDRSADIIKAASDILVGKTFDNGVLCSSPNSVVVDAAVAGALEAELRAQGGYFLSPQENEALARVLVTPQRLPNPALVGRSAVLVAQAAGIAVPPDTRALLARLDGVGRDYPLSIEKLCPVLSYYVVADWREGCERCKQILRYGGMGHTMSIHARDEAVILEFGLHKPAFRIIVNSPTTHGSIGLTTGLDPALTLGCGGHGGNITSDNISPMHLLNIKRLAYEVRPAAAPPRRTAAVAPPARPASSDVPPAPRTEAIDGATLSMRIDQFLASRGIVPASPAATAPPAAVEAPAAPARREPEPAVSFVCEDDVRTAMKAGRKIRLAPKAIVTPAARELAETHQVFE